MDIIITPSKLKGTVYANPSKSEAHRVLICSAFSNQPTNIICPKTSQDIEATVGCLRQLGANIEQLSDGYYVIPIKSVKDSVHLFCGECGATLRFLLPVVGALGISATFHLDGNLSNRPLSPLWELLEEHGCKLTRPEQNIVCITGKLVYGDYTLAGNVSSQFITGLLFAFSLMHGTSRLILTGIVESKPYIQMTQQVLNCFGVDSCNLTVCGSGRFTTPGEWRVEGDWSNAAFFLASTDLGNGVTVQNLDPQSVQGDKQILDCLRLLNEQVTISASDIPDLIPILSIVAACHHGAIFTDISRLRLKESDRVESILAMLRSLGCHCDADDSKIIIYPGNFKGCTIDSFGDHRIAMAAAIGATVADGAVTILNAHCVQKSYPDFWETYRALGGNYEQLSR